MQCLKQPCTPVDCLAKNIMCLIQPGAHSGILGALAAKQKRDRSRDALMLGGHRCTIGLTEQFNCLRVIVDHNCAAVASVCRPTCKVHSTSESD